MCGCMCMYGPVLVFCGALDPLEFLLEVFVSCLMWALGTKTGSSARAMPILNH